MVVTWAIKSGKLLKSADAASGELLKMAFGISRLTAVIWVLPKAASTGTANLRDITLMLFDCYLLESRAIVCLESSRGRSSQKE